ncbi:LOW QUALITY PROTEIN: GTP-binding protein Rheb [Meleagris gallopavo]|uniref:LOW QUALITY PROTEIN: GTP-binding protein Rheb n=1 Tax=Meleagris gallopavo TaxID=9103 RepID=UPI0012AB6FA5|nr:LOW QUALITY PROTEIN: GTP-binding protein Rheb [Meleagris gallopavo]
MLRITRGWKKSRCREMLLCCRRVLAVVSDLSVVTRSARRTCNDAVFFSRDQKRLREHRRFLDAVCIAAAWLQASGKTVLCLYGAGREQPAGGKSSLTIQFVEGQFVDSYDPTIENTFTKLITVNGQEYHLQLVDTAGQDEYSIFPQTYSIDINGYILVYSVTSIKSFEVIKVIHGKLLDMVGKVQIPIMLVGNKKDLHMERVISYEEGKALAESWNAAFLESSAKENQTAVDVFKRIILEAEKIDGAASQGKSSCSVM